MTSVPNSPKQDPFMEAEILGKVAEELHRLADEASERWRAAMARIGQPMPLFPDIDHRRDDEEGR